MALQLLDGLDEILRITENSLIREEIDLLYKDFDMFKSLSLLLTEENDYKFYTANLDVPTSWNFNQYLKHLIKAGGKGGRWILKSISQEVKKAKADKLFEKADSTVLDFLSQEFSDEFKSLFVNYQGQDYKSDEILKNWIAQTQLTNQKKLDEHKSLLDAEELKKHEIEIWQLVVKQLSKKNMLPISDAAVEYAARCLRKTFPKAVKESFKKHLPKGTYHHLDRGLSGQLITLTSHLLKFDNFRLQLPETTFWQLEKMADRVLKKTLLWVDPKLFDAFSIQETKRLAQITEELLHKIKQYTRQAQNRELKHSISTDSSLLNILDEVGRPLPKKIPTFDSSTVKRSPASDSGSFEFDSDVCLVAASEQGQIPPGQIVYPPPTLVRDLSNQNSDVSPIVEPKPITDNQNHPNFAATEAMDFRHIPRDITKKIREETDDTKSSADTSDGLQDKTHLIIDQVAITSATSQSATYKPAKKSDPKLNVPVIEKAKTLAELEKTFISQIQAENQAEEKSVEELLAQSLEQREEYMAQLSRIKQEAKELDRQISHQLRAKAVELIYQGEFAQAEKTLAQAEHYRAFKSQSKLIAARIAIQRGNLGIAQNIYNTLLEQQDITDEIRIESICGMAELFRLAGDIQGAKNYLISLELDYEHLEDCSAKYEFLKESGNLALISTEYEQAENLLEAAKKVARSLELPNLVADISRALGELYLARKEVNRASSPIELAINYHAELDSKLGMAADYLALASIELEKQDLTRMHKFLSSAEEQLQDIDAPLYWANFQKLTAEFNFHQRNYDQSFEFFSQAQIHYEEVGCSVEAGYMLSRLAAVEACRENWDGAWELLEKASNAYDEAGCLDYLFKNLRERTETYLRKLELDNVQIASWLWMSLLTKYERHIELAEAHELISKVHKQSGDLSSAITELEAALEIFRQLDQEEEVERIEFLISKIDPTHAT